MIVTDHTDYDYKKIAEDIPLLVHHFLLLRATTAEVRVKSRRKTKA